MRTMRLQEFFTVLPLLSFGSAASVLSSSSCTYARIEEKVQNFKTEFFEALLNGDSILIKCGFGFEPLNASAVAHCVEGAWEVPTDFQCVSQGFCTPPVKPGPNIRIVRTQSDHHNRLESNRNIFEDGERIIVKCKNQLKSKISSYTHSFRCVRGTWDPDIVPPCEHLPCPTLPTLENGSYKLVSEEVIEPECSNGFQHKGSKSLYCRNGTWLVRADHEWPSCVQNEVTKTPRSSLEQLQRIAPVAIVLICIVKLGLMLFCYFRRDSPKRNRLVHSTSHVDELLHLRRTKPIVIPDPVSHTQVHYTHDRKPIPVTSL